MKIKNIQKGLPGRLWLSSTPNNRAKLMNGPGKINSPVVKLPQPDAAAPINALLFWKRRGLRRYIGPKRIIVLSALAFMVGIAWYLRKQRILDPTVIEHMVQVHPVRAPLIFMGLYALSVLTGVPTLPMNLAGGLFWGPIFGGLFTTVAVTFGSIVAFAISRSIFGRPLARRFESKAIGEMQKEFDAKGWRFIAFIRINPVFPTGQINYILGLTSIDAITYSWATLVFLLPPSIAVAYIGYSVGAVVLDGNVPESAKLILGASAVITVLTTLFYGFSLFLRLRRKVGK
jgi:uncharacterized membrane protein YdjX (TVP38/TMEM64 family)